MVLDSSLPPAQLSTEISGRLPPRPTDPSSPAPTFAVKFISAGLAACIADLVTFPLDTAKVRLQIQGEKTGSTLAGALSSSSTAGAKTSPLQTSTRTLLTQANKPPQTSGTAAATSVEGSTSSATRPGFKYRGIFRTIYVISSEEGVRALYNGLVAGLHRQLCFASVRIGCYDSVKNAYIKFYHGGKLPPGGATDVTLRIMAGITTGASAVVFAQPTDVVKIRMQAQQGGGPKRYRGTFQAYLTIGREEGVRGLWKGVLPNITRNAIVNATELVSYDLIKEAILSRKLLTDNMPCHFVSAFGAGFCTTVVASPVDVVKTRYMNSAQGIYKGAIHCASVMYKEGGFWAFYKGFMPSFVRLGSWNICMFVSFEQLKRLLTRLHST